MVIYAVNALSTRWRCQAKNLLGRLASCKLKILLLPMLSSRNSFFCLFIVFQGSIERNCTNFFNFVVMELMKNIYLRTDELHLFTPIELQKRSGEMGNYWFKVHGSFMSLTCPIDKPHHRHVFWSWFGSFLAIAATAPVCKNQFSSAYGFGATSVLIFGVPDSPLAP